MDDGTLARLLGSRARARVLLTLTAAAGRELHTREIARLADVDYRAAWQELGRLEELGIALSTIVGRRRVWALRSGHALADAVRDVAEAAQKQAAREHASHPSGGRVPERLRPVLDDLRLHLAGIYGDRFAGLWLYGSQARGEGSPESDVDLLLFLDHAEEPVSEIDSLTPLLAEINLRSGILLSILPVTTHEFNEARGPFWTTVRREGVAA